MKKYIFTIIIGFMLTSCDPGSDCSVYVKNNCIDTISVMITQKYFYDRPSETIITHILPSENILVLKDLVLDTPPELDFIQRYFFSTITITKLNDTSRIDFMNPLLWELTTNQIGKNFDAKYILTVNPENFE